MRYTCPKCKHSDEITYSVVGFNIVDILINFKCHKCKLPGYISRKIEGVEGREQVEVEFDDKSYIG